MSVLIPFCPEFLPNFLTTGLFEVGIDWIHTPRNLECDALIYILEGTVYLYEGETEYEIKEGDVFLFQCGKKYYGDKVIKAGAKWFWICFSPSNIINSRYTMWLPNHFSIGEAFNIKELMHSLVTKSENNNLLGQLKANNLTHQILLELIDFVEQKSKCKEENYTLTPLSIKIREVVKTISMKRFSSEVIAMELSMNYSYLSRVFSEEMGMTINRYHMEMRIQRSISPLMNTEKSINEISDQLDFPNPYYFSRVFKKVTGFTPVNYRKRCLKELWNSLDYLQ